MTFWPAVFLLAFGILTRLAPLAGATFWPTHFAALTALALCGGVLLPRTLSYLLPIIALFVTDLLLNAHYQFPFVAAEMLPRYVVLLGTAYLGARLTRGGLRLSPLLGGALAASTVFYLVTNTASWLAEPAYVKSFAGWLQALTTGLPGFPPTWTFYRNSVIADLGFTALFYASLRLGQRNPASAAEALPARS
ncbi:MAG: hypothetical protein JSR82_12915 [Verrucomicrobia bacterium]|nr:hypothetical protein [Verrucomicrobiota bacterium]